MLFITEENLLSADVIVLGTSLEGGCFINTSSLDGEKNLKKRLKPKDFILPSAEDQEESAAKPSFTAECECELPNSELYEFLGTMRVG